MSAFAISIGGATLNFSSCLSVSFQPHAVSFSCSNSKIVEFTRERAWFISPFTTILSKADGPPAFGNQQSGRSAQDPYFHRQLVGIWVFFLPESALGDGNAVECLELDQRMSGFPI